MSIQINAAAPPRGGGTQDTRTIIAKSFNGTKAWGSNPGSFTLEYIGNGVPVTEGAELTVNVGGVHTFWGLCKTDVQDFSSRGGLLRRLSFVDFREYLNYDDVYCEFNVPDIRIVDGRRIKRYKHLYPDDYLARAYTFTDGPLMATTILDAIFNSQWVLTDWLRVYHPDMFNYPVYRLTADGKKLGAVLQEVSEKLGLLFGLKGGPYRLVWVRKGETGILPPFLPKTNDRTAGKALSGNATAIRVLGERNAYQLMDVPLTRDWAVGWEQFLEENDFANDIFNRATDPLSGQRYNAYPGDPERYIGAQDAYARSREITVRQYVDLRGGADGGGADFVDNRKFHGRSRMDMPAILYVKNVLYRAFRPNLISFTNWYGEDVPLDSIEIADKVLTLVTHDAVTGDMFWDETIPLDGNGYAIANGYQVGADLFRTLRPSQFNIDTFTNKKKLWEHIPFQLDDSGEGIRFVLFDEPVVVSDDLFVHVDGQTVINANYTLYTPGVKAALVVECERFLETFGDGDKFQTESVGGLYREAVASGGEFYEVAFADGNVASDKAEAISNSLLLRQYAYYQGGYKYPGLAGNDITDMIDRVTVVYGPREKSETIDWTSERQRNAFEPEREFDRSLRTQHLLPGQEELRVQANQARLISAAFKQNPGLVESLGQLFSGNIGPNVPLEVVFVAPAFNTPVVTHLPVGSIMRKEPTDVTTSPNTKTVCVPPLDVDKAIHTVFKGVTVRSGEDPTKWFNVQNTGEGLARVQGPVTVDDALGLSGGPIGGINDDGNYLIKGGKVATALAPITDASVKLIPVRFGVGGGGGDARWS